MYPKNEIGMLDAKPGLVGPKGGTTEDELGLVETIRQL